MAELSVQEVQELDLGDRLNQLVHQPGFEDLKKQIESSIRNTWPDPIGLKTEDIANAYLMNFGKAQMAQELLDWINSKIETAKYLRQKERGELPETKSINI